MTTKYIITNGSDDNFMLDNWTDLLNDESNDESDENNYSEEEEEVPSHCLISHEVLDENFVSLPCNHYFNFLPLYYELLRNNVRNDLPNIHCPYCRTTHVKTVLPRVKLNKTMVYKFGLNQPAEFCLPFHTCKYEYSSGKQKGKICDATAYVSNNGTYCPTHHKTVQIKKERENIKKEKEEQKVKLKLEKQKVKQEEKDKKLLQKQMIKEEKQKNLLLMKEQKQKLKMEKKLLKIQQNEEKKLLKKKKKKDNDDAI